MHGPQIDVIEIAYDVSQGIVIVNGFVTKFGKTDADRQFPLKHKHPVFAHDFDSRDGHLEAYLQFGRFGSKSVFSDHLMGCGGCARKTRLHRPYRRYFVISNLARRRVFVISVPAKMPSLTLKERLEALGLAVDIVAISPPHKVVWLLIRVLSIVHLPFGLQYQYDISLRIDKFLFLWRGLVAG